MVPSIKGGTLRLGYGKLRMRRLTWLVVACCAVAVAVLVGLGVYALRPPAGTVTGNGVTQPVTANGVTQPGWPRPARGAPASPPVHVCGNKTILGKGPSTPPKGAVVIAAGDDSQTVLAHNWTMKPNTTYWFARGTHTLGQGQFAQIIPEDGDTFVGAPGAVLDGQHENLYAFTQSAQNVTIRYLTIQNFGKAGDSSGQGVVNNDISANWHISHVTVRHSAGAGVMLGTGNTLLYSCLQDNGQYGFQGVGGGTDGGHILVDHNEIVGNNTDNWEARQPGCGCDGGAKFWSVNGATITNNYVHDNHGPGLWADTDDRGFDVEHNYIAANQGEGIIYEISYNLLLAHNTFVHNAIKDGPHLGGFPDGAVYISESGADPRVPGPYRRTLAITDNVFLDNWSGVVLWESADRFCGSPDNSSSDNCTLISPKTVTLKTCNSANIRHTQYYNDCRWKTQNVLVTNNYFAFDPADIGSDCTAANYCGFNGIFSQYGTQPSWSPYHGTVVEDHITFDQHNRFRDNAYYGPWRFVAHEQGNAVTWAQWRIKPYQQDAGSTRAHQ